MGMIQVANRNVFGMGFGTETVPMLRGLGQVDIELLAAIAQRGGVDAVARESGIARIDVIGDGYVEALNAGREDLAKGIVRQATDDELEFMVSALKTEVTDKVSAALVIEEQQRRAQNRRILLGIGGVLLTGVGVWLFVRGRA